MANLMIKRSTYRFKYWFPSSDVPAINMHFVTAMFSPNKNCRIIKEKSLVSPDADQICKAGHSNEEKMRISGRKKSCTNYTLT